MIVVADPRWKENQQVHRAASGAANELVSALAQIIESDHWREFIQPRGDIHAFTTFEAYCDGWLNMSPDAVLALLDLTNFQGAAMLVRQVIREGAGTSIADGNISGPSRLIANGTGVHASSTGDIDPRWKEVQAVYRAASGASHELIPALAKIVETENWREFVRPNQGLQTYATFAQFCDGVLGLSAEAIEALLNRSTAKHAARLVTKAIREGVEPLQTHGTNRWADGSRGYNVSSKNESRGHDPNHLLARLKRDSPELAAQVVEGTISAYAAAVKAGFIKRPGTFRTDDPELAIDSLLKYFTRDQLLDVLGSRSSRGSRDPGETPCALVRRLLRVVPMHGTRHTFVVSVPTP